MTGEKLYEKEKRLSTYAGEDAVVSSHELAAALKDTDDSVFKVKTGVPTLDRLHDGGLEAGELIVVTGPTGEGKTTLLMSITKNMAEEKVNSVWFTLEVTPRQFIKKITSKEGELPLFYLPKENIDNQIEWLEERICEAKVKHNVQVVFIDHLHQIFSMAKMDKTNMSLEIGDLTAKIKSLALNYNVLIFLIAHTKDDPTGSAREPRKEDIRDSGLISRLADSIIGVWRVPQDEKIDSTRRKAIGEDDTKAKVRLFKNRRTGRMTSWFMFHENHYLKDHSDLSGWEDDKKSEEIDPDDIDI